MTTKDFVYLGLLLLTALAFYCNGFYSGVCRSKRVYETLLNDAQQDGEETLDDQEKTMAYHDSAAEAAEAEFSPTLARRAKLMASTRQELRGDFGPN